MSPTLLFNALFVSYAAIHFNSVGALPNPAAVTVVENAAALATSSTPTQSTAATVVATTSAPASTSTDISPLGSATDVFNQGSVCKASWIPASSTSTTWKNMSIALMTGSNLQMSKLATVASDLDGTSSTTSSYEYACPDVTPNAPIYFLVRTTPVSLLYISLTSLSR
jgi:hypothetical protein